MILRITAQTDTDILDAIAEQAQRTPALMNKAMRRVYVRRRRDLLEKLQEEPPPVTPADYPLRWKSERQRRYVMAKLRREGNLPYRRTHAVSQGWEVSIEETDRGLTLYAENTTPHSIFVMGDYQQPMFIDIGWNVAAEIFVEEEEQLNDELIEVWYTISDPKAGIP